MQRHYTGTHRTVTVTPIGKGGGWYSVSDERHSTCKVVQGFWNAIDIGEELANTPYAELKSTDDPYLRFIK